VAAILPSTPGYVGVFHAAVVAALRVWSDVGADEALSYALVVHLVSFGVLLVLGPIGLRMLGLSAEDLQRRVMRTGASGGGPDDGGGAPELESERP
jgi:uncharacterized membrane protein YbhN (UPF0104 family)